ncbi:MAG: sulfite exporter TauE/SafE family protein [Proteobacteria bacterium]|nr:sulfite exporter TauE/SafE family protein [Pseudomonadota bacterium]MBU1743091.1 sulfite exporter TauE/SafE family protein [Pseudomonadota bacterium]
MKKLFRTPYIEILIMVVVLALSYLGMILIASGMETPHGGMGVWTIIAILFGSFILSFCIALLAVMGGIGGGVLFTPIMLAFTAVDSLVVRATGLIVAMFSGLISTGPFMKRGLANLKLCILSATAYGIGAFTGAQAALIVAEHLGATGEGLVRMSLGGIILALACYFIWGGQKIEWPEVKKVDKFTRWLNITQPYYEESLNQVVDYKLTRAWLLLIVVLVVGALSGFFGLGAGWAIVPALNLVMAVPLKVAAACSGVLLGMGDCIAVWPYLLAGAIIPLFAAPWLVGQVLGGLVGAYLLLRIKAGFIRVILIGVMFFTSFGLVTKGLAVLQVIGGVPLWLNGLVFLGCVAFIVLALMGLLPGFKKR